MMLNVCILAILNKLIQQNKQSISLHARVVASTALYRSNTRKLFNFYILSHALRMVCSDNTSTRFINSITIIELIQTRRFCMWNFSLFKCLKHKIFSCSAKQSKNKRVYGFYWNGHLSLRCFFYVGFMVVCKSLNHCCLHFDMVEFVFGFEKSSRNFYRLLGPLWDCCVALTLYLRIHPTLTWHALIAKLLWLKHSVY